MRYLHREKLKVRAQGFGFAAAAAAAWREDVAVSPTGDTL